MPCTVLLADDSEILRRVIRRYLLDARADFEIMGETASVIDVVRMVEEFHPQILLMDLHMVKARETAEKLKSVLKNSTLLLGMSFASDDEARRLAEEIGAISFIDKINLGYELIPAIQKLLSHAAEITAE